MSDNIDDLLVELVDECGRKPPKPPGFWDDETNRITKLREIMKDHSLTRMPSAEILNKLRESGLAAAIRRNGGFPYHRKLLGGSSIKVKKRYWNEKTIVSKLQEIMQEHDLDRIPPSPKLQELGYSGLVYAMTHSKGFVYYRELFGEDLERKPQGYWDDENNRVKGLNKIMKERGLSRMPTSKVLFQLSYSGLSTAIIRNGGFPYHRKLLGQELIRRPKGYWSDSNRRLEELERVMSEYNFDEIPGQRELGALGYGGLANAISKHSGFVVHKKLLAEYMKQNDS